MSTDRQAEEGLGLDVQRAGIARWAKGTGHRIALWAIDEGISGSNGIENRDALPDAVEAIRSRRAQGVVVYNLDRLARTLTAQEAILGHVWDYGGRVFSVGDGGEVPEDDPDDPMRTAMRQMRGVFSQLERSMIAKRLRDGRRMKATKGGYAYGSPPLGYRAEGKALIPVEDEQMAVARILALSQDGLSLREIVAVLDEEGLKPKRGGAWHPTTVARVANRLVEKNAT